MSNKSGSSSQIISLPQGGGAIQGIGEKFSPDLYTGTGNFTVPIALPPGRNGFQPELSLVYSTGNGNGSFGLGWGLSIPGVMRKTSQGIPIYDDEQDTFVLSGAEDLIPIERSLGVTRYQPRTEGLFARIEHHKTADNDYWKVWSKDGLISYYGTGGSAERREEPSIINDPRVFKQDNIFAWKLSRTIDPFGNQIIYEYERDLRQDEPRPWNQLYLKRIKYADFGDRTNPQFLVSISFEYEERPDPFSEYRSGFEMRMRRRCTEIQIRTHAEVERLVRTYNFIYLDRREDIEDLDKLLPLNGVSLLSQVKVVGHDGDNQESLPPLEFSYTRFEPIGRDFFPLQGRDLPARSLANPELELADLFGNGLPDILEMNGTIRYWRNLGNGKFDLPREMETAPAGLTLVERDVQLIDANGDGRIDLMVNREGLSGYFPLKFGGLWDRKSFQKYEVAPSFNLEGPEVKLVDLNGDGVTDAIRSGSRLECFFNDPQAGWTETRWVERRDIREFPNINFSDPRVKWGDMTGDGLQDIVLIHDGNVEYWPNLGYGNWGQRVTMRNSPRYAYGYDPRRILVGDIDGDGLDDIVYVDRSKVILWINKSGNGWSEPIEIKGTPPVSDLDGVRLVDLLGTGISGILWSADVGQLGRSNLYFLDFTGGVKPYMMNEMDNHMGSLTRVGYTSSIQFYLEDERRPETRWKTNLPFPVQVVSRVEAIDRISRGKLTTEYKYHHGYWDGAEREFRGFGRVEQCDSEVFDDYDRSGLHDEDREFERVAQEKYFSPPLLTKTWFHQGPVGEEFGEWEEIDYNDEYWVGDRQMLERPISVTRFLNGLERRAKRDALRTLRGQSLRTELYALDGTEFQTRPYTVTEALQGVREEAIATEDDRERSRIFFPYAIAQRTTQWERGDEPMTQFSFIDDYDAYGQPRKQLSIACDRAWRAWDDERSDYLSTYAETTFAQRDDSEVYIVDRAASATSYEIKSRIAIAVDRLRQSALAGTVERELIAHALNFYDGEAFTGLPNGQIDRYGALVRSETLVMLESQLNEAYEAEIPPYLDSSGSSVWTTDYPIAFREALITEGTTDATRPGLTSLPTGHGFAPGSPDSNYQRGYYTATARNQYDFQVGAIARGLLQRTRDPLGRDTEIAYDTPYALFPVEVIDPIGLTTQAIYDYRVLQPREATDPNSNRQRLTFSPLGLPRSIAVMGKEAESLGDTDAEPGSRFEYDFSAFEREEQPISVRTIQRQYHITETDVPLEKRNETIETVEYSDGFGRLVQTRTQAEEVLFGDETFGNDVLTADRTVVPGEVIGRIRDAGDPINVVVSGWQIYDNKGRVVEKYEPFYSSGWEYDRPRYAEMGQKVEMYYDSRGRVVLTINPDGSQQRVIYGVPVELDNPREFRTTPWEVYTYDANDLAPLSRKIQSDGSIVLLASRAPVNHHFTPSSIKIDALGRTIESVERNGANRDEWYITRSSYDIRGNLLTVTDALEREAFRYIYELTPMGEEEDSSSQVLKIENIDAGVRRVVFDAVGNELERRDSKGALILQAYDRLSRPSRLWARDGIEQPLTLREIIEYGDGGTASQSTTERTANRNLNRLGQPIQSYDEAGKIVYEAYDFKGNGLEKVRQVIGDEAILSIFPDRSDSDPDWNIEAFRIDWQTATDEILDPQEFRTSATYDALNRVKEMRYPQDVEGERKLLRPQYNRAGVLEQIELDNAAYVEHIAYNAKGQRTSIAYGNGVMTRYAYDPETFRLVRLRSERYSSPSDFIFRPTNPDRPLQDFTYRYDLVGNIEQIIDLTPESGFRDNPDGVSTTNPLLSRLLSSGDALIRRFSYDPTYRLIEATGRECERPPEPPPWDDAPRCTDLTRTRGYRETYSYDKMGNIAQLSHGHRLADGTIQIRNRNFIPFMDRESVPMNNRLETVSIGSLDYAHLYDANGNMVQENTSRHFEWDHSDHLKVFRTQSGSAEPSVHAHYLYDASGQRVKKLVRRQSGQIDVTVYVDGMFEYHRQVRGTTVRENNTLHVMDDQQRIALVRVGTAFSEDRSPAVRYHLGDHLGSSNVVVGNDGSLVNREEFTPYGETSFGSFAKKRYRFTGKGRDEESGLNYHGARYFVPWLGQWMSVDPKQELFANLSPYIYGQSNPIYYIDYSGKQPTNPAQRQFVDQVERFVGETEELAELEEAIGDLIRERRQIGAEMSRSEDVDTRRDYLRRQADVQDRIDNLSTRINRKRRRLAQQGNRLLRRFRSVFPTNGGFRGIGGISPERLLRKLTGAHINLGGPLPPIDNIPSQSQRRVRRVPRNPVNRIPSPRPPIRPRTGGLGPAGSVASLKTDQAGGRPPWYETSIIIFELFPQFLHRVFSDEDHVEENILPREELEQLRRDGAERNDYPWYLRLHAP